MASFEVRNGSTVRTGPNICVYMYVCVCVCMYIQYVCTCACVIVEVKWSVYIGYSQNTYAYEYQLHVYIQIDFVHNDIICWFPFTTMTSFVDITNLLLDTRGDRLDLGDQSGRIEASIGRDTSALLVHLQRGVGECGPLPWQGLGLPSPKCIIGYCLVCLN